MRINGSHAMNVLKIRKLHLWIGVTASIFLLILATTGIVLNHSDYLKASGKSEARTGVENKLKLTRGFKPEDLPVPPSKAIGIALHEIGENERIDKLEITTTEGGLVYKIETEGEQEIYIDPITGSIYEDNPSKGKGPRGDSNIVRLAKMLHTGDGLPFNRWLSDSVGIGLCFLVLTGLVMFIRQQR